MSFQFLAGPRSSESGGRRETKNSERVSRKEHLSAAGEELFQSQGESDRVLAWLLR